MQQSPNKTTAKQKSRSVLGKFSNLKRIWQSLIFVAVFAVIGAGILYITHASPVVNAPTNLVLDDASNTDVALNWTASTSSGVTGYEVIRNGVDIGSTDQYTTNYLDQNLSPNTQYSYAVEAVDGSSTSVPSIGLSVATAKTSSLQVISKCSTPTQLASIGSGNYILNSNISMTTPYLGWCLEAGGGSGPSQLSHISLNCQGHSISSTGISDGAIEFTDSNFLLINCNITSNNADFYVNNSNDGMIADNTFNTSAIDYVSNSNNVDVEHNSCTNACDLSTAGSDASGGGSDYFGFNTIVNNNPPQGVTYDQEIDIQEQSGDIVDGNNLTGDAEVSAPGQGLDDGINFGDGDSNTVIVNNTISKVFDCGIEGGSLVGGANITSTNDLILNNTISYALNAGICSYYNTSWNGVTVENNQVSNSSTLFTLYTQPFPNEPAPTQIYFENNNFINNSFTDPAGVSNTYLQPVHIQMTPVPSTGTVLTASNNTFTGNSFDYNNEASVLTPASMVVDGGNNFCVGASGLNCQTTQPNISFSAPSSGDTLSARSDITVLAGGSHGQGISKVQLFINKNLIDTMTATANQTSFSYLWDSSTVADGTYSLSATITDDYGLSATAVIPITVSNSGACVTNPTPPTSFVDSDPSPLPEQVDLSWSGGSAGANCTLAGYRIYRDGSTTPLNTVSATTTSYSDQDLAVPSATYQITVFDNHGHESALFPATPLTAYTEVGADCDGQTLTAPNDVTQTGNTYSSISLSWSSDSLENVCGLSGYNIYRSSGGGAPVLVGSVNATTTSYTDTGLTSSNTYYYSIQAFDVDNDNSPLSNAAALSTEADNQAPTAPTALSLSANSYTSVTLNWGASTDLPNPGGTGVAGYDIIRSTTNSIGSGTTVGQSVGTATSYTDTNQLGGNTTYYYWVVAYDGAGNTSSPTPSLGNSVLTPAPPSPVAPSAPTNVSSNAEGPNEIIVSWSPATDSIGQVVGYNIYYVGSTSPLNGSSLIPVASPTVSYGDTGVNPGTQYSYYVEAVNGAGQSSPASSSTTTTTAPQPPTNTTLSGQVTSRLAPNGLKGVKVSSTKGTGGKTSTTTLANGTYILYGVVSDSPHTIKFSHAGYKSVSVKATYGVGTYTLSEALTAN